MTLKVIFNFYKNLPLHNSCIHNIVFTRLDFLEIDYLKGTGLKHMTLGVILRLKSNFDY